MNRQKIFKEAIPKFELCFVKKRKLVKISKNEKKIENWKLQND